MFDRLQALLALIDDLVQDPLAFSPINVASSVGVPGVELVGLRHLGETLFQRVEELQGGRRVLFLLFFLRPEWYIGSPDVVRQIFLMAVSSWRWALSASDVGFVMASALMPVGWTGRTIIAARQKSVLVGDSGLQKHSKPQRCGALAGRGQSDFCGATRVSRLPSSASWCPGPSRSHGPRGVPALI